MNFRQRHPYLFFQLIGWGIFLADFLFVVVITMFEVGASIEFGEWTYPVIAFTFIAGLFVVTATPVIVWFTRRREVPQNSDDLLEKVIRAEIAELITARYGMAGDVITAILAFLSIPVFMFAAFFLGERVHLALGLASMVLAVTAPFIIVGSHSASVTKKFFTVKNGEKLIDFIMPPDLKLLDRENPPTFVIRGVPNAVLLNFFYNWLKYYLKTERLTLYKISAPDLCHDFQPISQLCYEDVLLCIPTKQLDLTKEKETLFNNECDIMGVFPFRNFLVFNEKPNY
ncbi:MAG: hypothetical protein K2N06_04275 [Oscillospiraceae bacterium]|nr:hypothetical protein [Oscillospiraceae bacterium]